MKTAALCVDELTLQSVAMALPGDAAAPDGGLLIGLGQADAREKKRPFADDTASEAATVKAEDDEDDDAHGNPAKISKQAEPPVALGFMERMVREYTLKREIHALISKKQTQLRHMQALIAAYQEQLLRAIALLDEETAQQAITQELLERETRTQLTEALTTGAERALVEATRAVGLLLLQRHRILKERTALRKTAITTRQEECEWLLKSIVAQHEQECDTLLSAITAKKFLEEGSLQATLAVQITQDDPIFAPVETLYEAQPMARQLQLQLDSIEGVIESMKEKCDMLEAKNIIPSGPVPLVKRSSFLDRRQDSGFPTCDRKRVVRLCLLEGKRIRTDRTCMDLAGRHKRYTSVLHSLDRMLSDVRTRSGRLLLQFIEKLHNDTMTVARVTAGSCPENDSESNQSEHRENDHGNPNAMADLVQERFIMARLFSLADRRLRELSDNETTITLTEEPAVDTLALPPPAMIAAFTKFLSRVITTEYELLAAAPPVDENDESTATNLDDQSFEDAMDQTVLQDCIHEMVFRRITHITYASAIDEYNFARQDDFDGVPAKFLFPWHWQHSKGMLQQLSPSELAFPEDAMCAVTAFLERHEDEVRRNGFLPQTLSLFRTAERETTPKGVVRAVMAGFKMLHREIVTVLSADNTQAQSSETARRRPQRRGSSFLNADILIPTLVLMMSRLPHPDYLDRLWHRSLLVEAFRSSALTDGGEEAYYLTCLSAAMEFINTFMPSSAATGPETVQFCSTCEQMRSHIERCGVTIEPTDPSKVAATVVRAAASPASAQGRPKLSRTTQIVGAWSKKEHESIKQLSKWISDQPPTESSVTTDAVKFVAPHELWRRDTTVSLS